MITLNGERGLVHVESWDDVTSLPGFVAELDPTTATLDAIIGSYLMPDEVPCGLSNCRQPHNRGYVVTTKDGRTTNLGKDCGKRHFSVEFEAMRSQFDRDLRRSQQREQLHSFQNTAGALEERLAALRGGPRGADWMYKRIGALMSRVTMPNYIVTALSQMIRTRSSAITMERAATLQEVEAMEIAEERPDDAPRREDHRRPRFVAEEIGQLDGLAALYAENDLKELLVVDLGRGLADLRALDVDSLPDRELSRFSKWVVECDSKLDHVLATMKAAERLLAPRNIGQLADLARSKDDAQQVAAFVKTLKPLVS